MVIEPLPVYEADADPANRELLTDAERLERLKPPKTIVVRFGFMKLVGEYRYEGDATPGCGSKLVVRTHRGTELAEMLTTTCENAGCGKSVTRQEMRAYIDQSGGKDFPFFTDGKVLRVATVEDLNCQSELMSDKGEKMAACRDLILEHNLPMTLVDVEPILGGELLTFFYMSEDRVDFRELVRELASKFHARIDLRQVGARDEARLVADYERCGQHCCCKSFLKVLKPVSMRAAKVQKATLDPLKISGRCGRLMCCLRYEDQTYKDLKKNLPHRKTRVGTAQGPGIVIDSKILVQLVLVKLEHDDEEIAVPVEELMDPETCPRPAEIEAARQAAAAAALEAEAKARRAERAERATRAKSPPDRAGRSKPRDSDSPGKKRSGRRRDRRGRGGKSGAKEDVKPSEAKQKPEVAGGEKPPEEGRTGRRKRRRGKPKGAPKANMGDAAPKAEGEGSSGRRRSRRRSRRGRSQGEGGSPPKGGGSD